MTEDGGPAPRRSGFQLLLERLDRNAERAGAEFERLRRTLTRYFDWRGVSWPDDCADETLDRLARKLEEGVAVIDIPSFLHGIARMVLHESHRSDARRATLEEVGYETATLPDRAGGYEDEALGAHLERCLDQLPDNGRALVLAYYAGTQGRVKIEARQRLARSSGLTDNALRSRVQRLRDRLEECVRRHAGGAVRDGRAR